MVHYILPSALRGDRQLIMVRSQDPQESLELHHNHPEILSEPAVVQLQLSNEITTFSLRYNNRNARNVLFLECL